MGKSATGRVGRVLRTDDGAWLFVSFLFSEIDFSKKSRKLNLHVLILFIKDDISMHKTRSMLLYADNESSIHTVTHNESEVDRLRAGRCAIV